MRKELDDNMDDLLVKYLLEEATRQEREVVEEWILEKQAHRNYFENFKLIWNRSKHLAMHTDVDENMAWVRFKDRVQEVEEPVIPMYANPFYRICRIAAAIAIFAGAGWYMYLILVKNDIAEQIAIHSGTHTLIKTLPDGSVITLNKNSSITYAEEFTAGNSRQVELEGEAFFQVTPDKTKPFLIHANDVTVRVVGTSFNVKSSAERTEIVVETGLVEIAKREHKIELRPKERVIARKNSPEMEKQISEDHFYDYYRTQKLVCNDTPLWKLAEVLSEAYRSDIKVSPERKDLPINTTFEGKSLNEILNIISETFNITVVRKDGQIILK